MTAPVTFGTLVDVEARTAWAHEAHVFTPWLAENLDRLSAAIGIPLELTGREVGVGRYSADILATNPTDGTIVLIENQLAPSDHTHLGQIMTYLAGLDAQVIVWLAPTFREEHLSALRWLNQHTDERFSFFAVRLRVVQIGDGPMAPLFDVLEKPNSWDKSLNRTARAVVAASSESEFSLRNTFWAACIERDPAVADDRRIGGGTVRWRAVPGTGLVVSRYTTKDSIGVFLRGPWGQTGTETLARLEEMSARIAAALGVPLGNPDYPFSDSRPVDWTTPVDVAAAADWLVARTAQYVATTDQFLHLDPA